MLPEKDFKKAESTNTFKRPNLRRKRSFLAVLAWLSLLLASLCGAGIEDAGAYTLTMSVSGSGNVSPGSMTFSDLPLTITATPDTGWEFLMWAGSGASNLANASAYETTLVLAANTTVTAIFEKIDYTLAIDVASGNGSVSPASGTSYNYDTGLGISATADAGWEFTGWTGDTGNLANPGAATTTINSDTFGNTTVHANFVKIDYTLTIDVATGNGSVSPASGTSYNYDTGLGISATADAGWEFTGWTGDTGNLANPGAATTTINSDTFGNTTVHANFVKIDYTLTIDVAHGQRQRRPGQRDELQLRYGSWDQRNG
ncbi:MAG: hypothetical protein U5J82_04905 [Desulfobacterales bacterium]|nr:hypothetical protein [Desulfobacterales bacterium]